MIQPNALPTLALRISLTDRCQLRCGYCMPAEGIECQPREEIISFEEIIRLVDILKTEYRIEKIRLTGGEPLLRKDIVGLIEMLAGCVDAEIALTTNGQALAPLAQELKRAGLQRINISLDSLDAELYRTMTRGGELARTLAGIDAALQAGLQPVKLNAVVLRGINEGGITDLVEFAIARGCEQRFLEIMPIGHGAGIHEHDFVKAGDILHQLRQAYKIELMGRESGSSAVRYRVMDISGREGVVGIIAPCTAPFCADCRRLRITTDGGLVGCLACSRAIPARGLLDNPPEFLRAVKGAFGEKRHDALFSQPRVMASIGG
jgi:cyclic pyranopterin phosphate synthase